MSHENHKELADVTAFKCSNCDYIHTTHDGTEPNQCVDCGRQTFIPVDPESTNSSDPDGFISQLFNDASFKQIVLYLLFLLIVFGSLIITLILIFI